RRLSKGGLRTTSGGPPAPGARAVSRTLVAWYRSFTHLAREGRMTVTIGRRELLAALGGTAGAGAPAARAQQPSRRSSGRPARAAALDASDRVPQQRIA